MACASEPLDCETCCCKACTEKDVHGCGCCVCVPRRLCAALTLLTPDYACDDCVNTIQLLLDEPLFEDTGAIEYFGTIGCNGEVHDLLVSLVRDEYEICVWRVSIETLYIEEDFELRGDDGVHCDFSGPLDVEVSLSIGGCDLLLTIEPDAEWLKLEPYKEPDGHCLHPWCSIGGEDAPLPIGCRCICPALCVCWVAEDAYVLTADTCCGVIPWDEAEDISSEVIWEGTIECARYTTTVQPASTLVRTLQVRVRLYWEEYTRKCLVDVRVEDLTPGGEYEGIVWETLGYELTACLTGENALSVPLPDVGGLFITGPTLGISCADCGQCPPTLVPNPCCEDEEGNPVNWPATLTLTLVNTGGCANLDGLTTTLFLDECSNFPEIGPLYFGTLAIPDPVGTLSFCLGCGTAGQVGIGIASIGLAIYEGAAENCCDTDSFGQATNFATPDGTYPNSCDPVDLRYRDQGVVGKCRPIPPLASYDVYVSA